MAYQVNKVRSLNFSVLSSAHLPVLTVKLISHTRSQLLKVRWRLIDAAHDVSRVVL